MKLYFRAITTTPSLVVFGEPSSKSQQQQGKMGVLPASRPLPTTTPVGGIGGLSFVGEEEEDEGLPRGLSVKASSSTTK
jgi:hypothetical protein